MAKATAAFVLVVGLAGLLVMVALGGVAPVLICPAAAAGDA
jgi:hypothetical protein